MSTRGAWIFMENSFFTEKTSFFISGFWILVAENLAFLKELARKRAILFLENPQIPKKDFRKKYVG